MASVGHSVTILSTLVWSFFALHGRAAEVYDFAAFHAFEQSVSCSASNTIIIHIRRCCCS